MNKLRVGMRVRLKMDTCAYAGCEPGDIGVITNVINNERFHVNYEPGCHIEFWDICEDQPEITSLELEIMNINTMGYRYK